MMPLDGKKVILGVFFAVLCFSAVCMMVIGNALDDANPATSCKPAANVHNAISVPTSKISKRTLLSVVKASLPIKIGIALSLTVFLAAAIWLAVYLFAQNSVQGSLEEPKLDTPSVGKDPAQAEALEQPELWWKLWVGILVAVVFSLAAVYFVARPRFAYKEVAKRPTELDIHLYGNQSVGKTSIISRFITGSFSEVCPATICTVVTQHPFSSKGEPFELNISENIGFVDIADPSHSIAVIVYSVTDESSFNNLELWYGQINPERCILVANKVDDIHNREISEDAGVNMANRLNCTYIETSAKSGANIRGLFEKAIDAKNAPPIVKDAEK